MKVSETFLKAKKDKDLRHFVFRMDTNKDGTKRAYMRLCLDKARPYGENTFKESIFVETDTDISFENYRSSKVPTDSIREVVFMESARTYDNQKNHINTFLAAINKNTDVRFRVRAFNQSSNLTAIGWVRHELYAILDDKREYLIGFYVNEDNLAAAVQY